MQITKKGSHKLGVLPGVNRTQQPADKPAKNLEQSQSTRSHGTKSAEPSEQYEGPAAKANQQTSKLLASTQTLQVDAPKELKGAGPGLAFHTLQQHFDQERAAKSSTTQIKIDRTGEISDAEQQAIQAAVRLVLDSFAGYLNIPDELNLKLQHDLGEMHWDDIERVLKLGYTSKVLEPPSFLQGSICHETGHMLFGRNVKLQSGLTLSESYRHVVLDMQRKHQLMEQTRDECWTTMDTYREQYQEAQAAGNEEEAQVGLAKYNGAKQHLEPLAEQAMKEFLAAVAAKDEYHQGPVRACNELWADLIAVITTDKPGVMLDELKFWAEKHPEQKTQELLRIAQRDFSRPAAHRFHDLSDDPYTMLDTSRHYIWEHYLSDPDVDKQALAVALMQVMEQEIQAHFAGELEFEHTNVNQRLLSKLNARMGRPDLPVHIDLKTNAHYQNVDPEDFPKLLDHALGKGAEQ